MGAAARVRVTGPLSIYVTGFSAELSAQGYTDLSLTNQLRLMADFSRWLGVQRVALHEVSEGLIARFLTKRRRTHTAFLTHAGLKPLLGHLRSVAGLPEPVHVEVRRSDLVRRYEMHLEKRGLTRAVRDSYLAISEDLLDGRGPGTLTMASIGSFVTSRARSPNLAMQMTGLRSVLRYLFQAGETSSNLVYAVPSAPRYRLASLPQALEPAEIKAVLATCDRRTTAGRRDYAALLLMVRLGLRAGEVAALSLDDLDWEAGEIVVHGKRGKVGRLPLPADVGDALVAYLRHRWRGAQTRSVFLLSCAPYRGVRSGTIVMMAGCALRAAGIASGGAHRLRHTAATQMLRRGASLTEIAQVLRHQHVDTTAIYAKVDHDRLRDLARPWPSGSVPKRQDLRQLALRWPGGAA